METSEIITRLALLSKDGRLSAFAQAANLDRRTLQRLASDQHKPHRSTLALIEAQLRKPKWQPKETKK